MDDLRFGTRDKRGNWKPNEKLEVAPLLAPRGQPAQERRQSRGSRRWA